MKNFPVTLRSALSRLLFAALLARPVLALAQFTTPNVINVPGDVTNALGPTTIINHGLVGVGHISASALDSFGETFGSVSSMQITGWTNNGNGSYSGTLNILPDRGYISQTVLGNGNFQMTFTGPSAQSYKVAATTNLAQPIGSWMVLTNGVFGSGPVIYTDTGTVGQPQRFYLLISP